MSTSANYTVPFTTHTALKVVSVATNRTITVISIPTKGGSVSGAGVVGSAMTLTLRATPAPGYYFSSWTLDGVPVGTANPVTFEALGDYAFVANFLPVPTLTMIHGETPGHLMVSWPAPATGWVLEASPDLVTWSPCLHAINTAEGQNSVKVPTNSVNIFFRLTNP